MTPPLPKIRERISEATLVEWWLAGLRGVRRIEDGRAVRVVFPGILGGGRGPDVRDAVLELAGDTLRGDIEVHLRDCSWYEHGHDNDPAYSAVVLHLVAGNDGRALASRLRSSYSDRCHGAALPAGLRPSLCP